MIAEINQSAQYRNFLYAKSKPEDQYKNGPIMISGENYFWILAAIHNESAFPAHNVRISINVPHDNAKSVTVHCQIYASDDAESLTEVSNSDIAFVSDIPFSLEYVKDSAFMYSEAYGLNSDHSIRLENSIMHKNGCQVGFLNTKDDIPCGYNNTVTVSIRVKINYILSGPGSERQNTSDEYTVFISHTSKDIGVAEQTKQFLNQNNVDSWMSEYSIPIGGNYTSEIPKAIRKCDAFIVLLSNNSQLSDDVQNEVILAKRYKKRIFPINIDNCQLNDSFQYLLASCQIIDGTFINAAYNRILNSIKNK